MAHGSNGYRAAPVRRRLTPGRISLLPVTGALPLSISFSTSCPELESTGRGSGSSNASDPARLAPPSKRNAEHVPGVPLRKEDTK
jgi:hypothetical protein